MLPIVVFTQELEARFQEIVDSIYTANKDAVGILIHVESPDENISWTAAVGLSDTLSKKALNKEQPVLIASNTKSYVAAAILRLVEMEVVALDQPIKKILTRKTRKLFEKGGYDLQKITVRHLLSHTSGIHDYVDDDYFNFVDENPQYHWQKEEQIKRTIEIGEPLALAGAKFSCRDINYLLLTEIIEKKTKQPFYTAISELLKFKELGILHTWFKDLEPYPQNTLALAHQYADKKEWTSYELNPSWDLYGRRRDSINSQGCCIVFSIFI